MGVIIGEVVQGLNIIGMLLAEDGTVDFLGLRSQLHRLGIVSER